MRNLCILVARADGCPPTTPTGPLVAPTEIAIRLLGQDQCETATSGGLCRRVGDALPLGDITSNQMRALADICRKCIKDTVRTVVEQNLLLRWVR